MMESLRVSVVSAGASVGGAAMDEDVCLSATDSAFGPDDDPSCDIISSLPYEVAVHILLCVDSLASLANIARLSKRWAFAASDNNVWKSMFVRRWGLAYAMALHNRLNQSGFFVHPLSSASSEASVASFTNPQASVSALDSISKASADKFKEHLESFAFPPSVTASTSSKPTPPTPDPTAASNTPLNSHPRSIFHQQALPRIANPNPMIPDVSFWDPRGSETPSSSNHHLSQSHVPIPTHMSDINNMDSLSIPRTWKSVYQQRLRLYRNWAHGDYTVRSFTGHGDAVYCIQVDGDLLASGSRDKTLKFWDLSEVRCLRILTGHEGSVLCMQHDGARHIVTGSSDATAILWDYATGQPVRRFTGHALPVLDIRFDERRVVTCSKDCTVKCWDISTGMLRYSMEGHQAAVNAVHMCGDLVVSASGDCVVKMWNLNTGALVRNFVGHSRGLACVQFDGETVLSGSNDFTIKVWDAATGVCLRTLEGHTNLVRTLCFDEERIVSGSYDNTIKVWDRKTGELLHTLGGVHSSWVFHVQMDKSRIVSSAQDKKIAIWEFGRGCNLVKQF